MIANGAKKNNYMDKFYCDICTAEMEQMSISKAKRGVRIRRYKCPICDYKKTIFGNGYLDEELTPNSGINDVNKIFKQEEINRYYDNNTDNRGYASLQDVEEISSEWDDGCSEGSGYGVNQ